MWRIGHASGALEFPPWEFCSWEGRFDDSHRQYRTLYCAERRVTCFREVLADLRPNARALLEFRNLFGNAPESAGSVSAGWRKARVLAAGRIEILDGDFLDTDDLVLRREFERDHAELLHACGMEHLDISQVRSRTRPVTQALSRFLFERGAAGIAFRSNLDDLSCVALFEDRARVVPEGEPEPLIDPPEEFFQVCTEFALAIGESGAPLV